MIRVGINYNEEKKKDILKNIAAIDLLEIYTEKFFIHNNDAIFTEIINKIPIVLHGLDLSLGSLEDLDNQYLESFKQNTHDLSYLWFSDHLSMTKIDGYEVGHLMPVVFNEIMVHNVVKKINEIKKLSPQPFLLENITYYYRIPGTVLEEPDFIQQILIGADCGMLLDLNNLIINSRNHHYCPYEFLKQIPLDRVQEIHVAGGSYKFGMHVDTHANAVSSEVWGLFDHICKISSFKGVIVERDANLDNYQALLKEVEIAKAILQRNGLK